MRRVVKELKGYPVRWRELERAVQDPVVREALKRALASFSETREEAIKGEGDFSEGVEKWKEIKERALQQDEELWSEISGAVEASGGYFHFAPTAEEACSYIGDIAQDSGGKLVVKGKSITSEEIGLAPYLESKGFEVVETDLGERIVQLAQEKPSHLIVPAIHKTKEEVACIFSQYLGKEISPDPFLITKEVRRDLREKFLRANTGITGVNVVSAKPPLFFLMTNEGNGRLCATLPKVQVILVGWEKIVEKGEDAFSILDILPKNSAGLRYSSYVSVFSAPFTWRKGRQWHVVVVDNGRRRTLKDSLLRDALRCIRCGACMNVCPIYRIVGGQIFSHVYMGGIGAVWTAITGGLEKAKEVASLCTSCGTCMEVCPVGIPIPRLVERVRELAPERSILERGAVKLISNKRYLEGGAGAARLFLPKKISRLPGPAAFFTTYRVLETPQDRSFSSWAMREGLNKDMGGDLTLYVGCMINYFYPQIGKDAVRLLMRVGVSLQLMEEVCCGLPARVIGEESLWEKLALTNISNMPRGKPLLFLCATCMSAIKDYEEITPNGVPEILDLSQWLLRVLVDKPFPGEFDGRVAFHWPCHLEHHLGIKEAPIELLKKVGGIEIVDDRIAHLCCGGAGLYAFKNPPVSAGVLEEKLSWIQEKGVDVIITSCPSCIMQLRGGVEKRGLPVRVLHLATFLRECLKGDGEEKDKGVSG